MVLLRSLPYSVLYCSACIVRRKPRKRRKNSRLNRPLRSNWRSLHHHKRCQRRPWASTCLRISSRNSTHLTPELHLCTRHTLCTPSSHRYLRRHHMQLHTALRIIPAMRSQHIQRRHILVLPLRRMPNSRLWTLDTHNKVTLRQHRPPTSHMLHHRRRNSTTRHLESQHTRRLWFLQPLMVATRQCSIKTMYCHRCHHLQ